MKIVILGGGTAGLIAGLILREKYPFYDITLVKSNEIGIVGVGEGSTEHWKFFCDFVGIDVKELIVQTNATIKIGIRFTNWNGDGKSYVHSVDSLSEISPLGRHDVYNLLMCRDDSEYKLNAEFENIYLKNNLPLVNSIYSSNQYHFDTFKLNNFLLGLCVDRSINVIDTEVLDARLREDGSVDSLQTIDGNVDGDFFVDCSGFKKFIATKLQQKWISFKKFLPLDSAIFFPTEHQGEYYEPYTHATALKNGWAWKIPTQSRYGNGYVFSSDFCSSQSALEELKCLYKIEDLRYKEIKFEAGRLENFWVKNCVFIGLSSSFAEPLEAQSIGFAIIQSVNLMKCIETWELNKSFVSASYNKLMKEVFDNVIDYLQVHYFTKRNDSEFWRQKPFVKTSFNNETFDIFSKGHINPHYFSNQNFMFKSANFYQVYAGLGLIDISSIFNIIQSNREAYNNNISTKTNKSIPASVNHKKMLELIRET